MLVNFVVQINCLETSTVTLLLCSVGIWLDIKVSVGTIPVDFPPFESCSNWIIPIYRQIIAPFRILFLLFLNHVTHRRPTFVWFIIWTTCITFFFLSLYIFIQKRFSIDVYRIIFLRLLKENRDMNMQFIIQLCSFASILL